MPNHITNVIRFSGNIAHIKELLTAIQNDEEGFGSFDFNKLIPMPESLDIESGSRTQNAMEIYLTYVNPDAPDKGVPKMEKTTFNQILEKYNARRFFQSFDGRLTDDEIVKYTQHTPLEELMELGKVATNNIRQYGAATWYEWSLNNWGTKWNAYDCFCDCDNRFIEFNTAWDGVPRIAEKLAEKFPNVSFTYLWADENTGCNVGMMRFEGGSCVEEFFPLDGSKEAYELCAEVMNEDLSDMGYRFDPETENYKYVEDESQSVGEIQMM